MAWQTAGHKIGSFAAYMRPPVNHCNSILVSTVPFNNFTRASQTERSIVDRFSHCVRKFAKPPEHVVLKLILVHQIFTHHCFGNPSHTL